MPRGREEIIGYGDYRRVGPDYGMQEALSYGVYSPQRGAVSLAGLLDPLLDTETTTGLVAVRQDAVTPAVAALQSMSWEPGTGPEGVLWGKATYLPGPNAKSGDWVNQFVGQGYMVMVEVGTVSAGSPNVAATKIPAAIVALCTAKGGWAMLTGPVELVVAAQQLLLTAPPPPDPVAACYAGGGMWDGESSKCIPRSSSGAPPPEKNSWILPVAVIGGVVVVAGLLLLGQRD
jgi:hypothetical protein